MTKEGEEGAKKERKNRKEVETEACMRSEGEKGLKGWGTGKKEKEEEMGLGWRLKEGTVGVQKGRINSRKK